MYPDQNRPLREDIASLVQFVVICFIIFWATGLGGWLGRTIPNIARNHNPYVAQRPEKGKELHDLFEKKVARAEKLGKAYTTSDYFQDYRDMVPYERYELPFTFGKLSVLQEFLRNNSEDKRSDAYDRLLDSERAKLEAVRDIERKEVERTTAAAKAIYEQAHPSPPPQPWWMVILGFLGWVIFTYLKVAGLSSILYLSRTASRQGGMRTLQGFKRLLAAIALWPRDIWEYPFPILREFLAKAEVRRTRRSLKEFLEPLTSRETSMVRQVASTREGFRAWRTSYRLRNPAHFGLVAAFVLCLTLVPLASQAQTPGSDTHSSQVITQSFDAVSVPCICDAPDPPWHRWEVLFPPPFPDNLLVPLCRPRQSQPPYKERWPGDGWLRDIFHVPLTQQMFVI